MPHLTDILELPYPDEDDAAVVPSDVKKLAERIEALLIAGDLNLASVGDLKESARSEDHGRWLRCDGRTMTQAMIEEALKLDAGEGAPIVALLKTGSASIYGTAETNRVKLPDTRRSFKIGAGPGADGPGGLTPRPLKGEGSSGGAETVKLNASQSGIAAHTHALTDPGHSHVITDPGHSHGASQTAHSHGVDILIFANAGAANGLQVNRGGNGFPTETVIQGTDTQAPTVTVSSHTTGVTVNSKVTGITLSPVGAQEAANAHANMPPFVTVGYTFIRV